MNKSYARYLKPIIKEIIINNPNWNNEHIVEYVAVHSFYNYSTRKDIKRLVIWIRKNEKGK